MVLMPVIAIMGQDNVGRETFLERLNVLLDRRSVVREETVAETFHQNLAFSRALKKETSALKRFFFPLSVRTQNHPGNFQLWMFLEPAEDRASAADLNIVGVGTQTQNPARGICRLERVQGEHQRCDLRCGLSGTRSTEVTAL